MHKILFRQFGMWAELYGVCADEFGTLDRGRKSARTRLDAVNIAVIAMC